MRAAINRIDGLDRVSRLFFGLKRKHGLQLDCIRINGELAMLRTRNGEPYSILAFDTDGERIYGFYQVLNPDKLADLPRFANGP